ncbi:unnamed protein product [Gadus morhua 'NCC']
MTHGHLDHGGTPAGRHLVAMTMGLPILDTSLSPLDRLAVRMEGRAPHHELTATGTPSPPLPDRINTPGWLSLRPGPRRGPAPSSSFPESDVTTVASRDLDGTRRFCYPAGAERRPGRAQMEWKELPTACRTGRYNDTGFDPQSVGLTASCLPGLSPTCSVRTQPYPWLPLAAPLAAPSGGPSPTPGCPSSCPIRRTQPYPWLPLAAPLAAPSGGPSPTCSVRTHPALDSSVCCIVTV